MDLPPHSACGQNQTPMGYIAYLKPGQTPASLSAEGLSVTPLTALAQTPPTVLVGPPVVETTGSSAPALVGPAPSGAAAYGLVYPQASEPSLRSCDYQLADSTADAAYVSGAEAVLLSNGLVTQKQLETDPIFFVSDDPLDPSLYIVTVKVLGASMVAPPNTPPGVTILSTLSYAALVLRSSSVAVAFGRAPW